MFEQPRYQTIRKLVHDPVAIIGMHDLGPSPLAAREELPGTAAYFFDRL